MISIASPLAGWVTPLDEVPDPVFADRMLGDGVAIDPTDGRLVAPGDGTIESVHRSEEHTSELQSLMRISYAVFCLTKKNSLKKTKTTNVYKNMSAQKKTTAFTKVNIRTNHK